ncbi:MAG: molybdopterin-dependent oxidoreductase, partial [bacterium]|nr:molybdopterin-dependent oxidoreductase [bacterium]
RSGLQGRVKMGFRRDGRLTAVDLFLVQGGGPYGSSGDLGTAASVASLTFQPIAMRYRGISVYTNTPPRGIQRAPGGEQAIAMLSPLMNKAAHQLGLDPAEILHVNAPSGQAEMGAPRGNGQRRRVSSAFAREAIAKGVEIFNWHGRLQRAGQRNGTKATGVGIALSSFMAGSSGLDGLMVIRPDGRLYIHQGIGNLGTESFSDTARIAAETLGLPWERVEIIWGDTGKSLPWSTSQAGSATTTGHTRSNLAA